MISSPVAQWTSVAVLALSSIACSSSGGELRPEGIHKSGEKVTQPIGVDHTISFQCTPQGSVDVSIKEVRSSFQATLFNGIQDNLSRSEYETLASDYLPTALSNPFLGLNNLPSASEAKSLVSPTYSDLCPAHL